MEKLKVEGVGVITDENEMALKQKNLVVTTKTKHAPVKNAGFFKVE